MTASPINGPVALIQTWRELGVSDRAARVLIAGHDGVAMARAVRARMKPDHILVLTTEPSDARIQTSPLNPAQLADDKAGTFDLILTNGLADEGELAFIRDQILALSMLLAPAGRLCLAVTTLGAPGRGGAEDALDPILFPQLARSGQLRGVRREITPLPSAGWISVVQAAGLEVLGSRAHQGLTLTEDDMIAHGPRLDLYDAAELARGDLLIVARRKEA